MSTQKSVVKAVEQVGYTLVMKLVGRRLGCPPTPGYSSVMLGRNQSSPFNTQIYVLLVVLFQLGQLLSMIFGVLDVGWQVLGYVLQF